MAKKIVATAGNYLTVTDTVSGIQEINHPTANLYYRNSNGTIRFHAIDGNTCLGQTVKGYPFGVGSGSVTLDSSSLTAANGTVTLASALANAYATGTVTLASAVANTFATGTVTCVSAIAGETVTVNGLTYTGVAGVKADNTQFSIDTGDTETATDLADSITNDTRTGTFGDLSATNSLGVVTITTDIQGTAGNGVIALSSNNGTTLAVSGAFLTGGVNADTVTVNGLTYTAVTGVKADNTEFSIDTSDTAAATDLADSITNDARTGTVGDLSAVGAIAVVTITTDVLGTGGNAVTLLSSNGTRLAVSGSTFTGGINADTVNVNGLTYTAVAGAKADNTEFSIDTSNDAAATDLADSIDNDARVGLIGDVSAVAATDTVTITSDAPGIEGNSVKLSSSNGTRLAVSGNFLSGGLNDGDITGITVNGVQIMSGTVSLSDTLSNLAKDIALNINNYTSIPNYTASAHGTEITIYDMSGDTASNGFVVVSSGTNISTTDTNLAGAGADIVDGGDLTFTNFAALITFLDANTGA